MKRNCLDRDELELALSGRLAADDFEAAISHLDDCDQCRTAAESFQQQGQWMIDSLAGSPDPLQAETACQIALWQVLETPDFSVSGPSDVGTVPQEMLGPYRLIRPLGSGGMAAVYLAEHVRLQRQCAIKILPRERVDEPGWLDRFDREMTTIASLEHPHVVRATDAGHQDGWHYLVMEHLDGLDVGRVVSRMGQLDVADACEIVRQAALGLAHIHASGLVHRDIKPSNMMLTREGAIKLLDLGLVLSGDDPLSVDDRLTTVGHLMGTMPYMAPEQLIDSRDVDARADIYALGATLYRLIAGRPPHHRHGGLAKHVMAITHQDAPPLDSVREDVDKELVKFVSEMISRDPTSRPQTADEVAERLSEIGKNAQLKRLLRQSMRRSSPDSPALSSVYPLSTIDPSGGSRRLTARGLFAIAIMTLMVVVAGFVFKIATDRGELVINSPQDGVVLSVSRGDEIVEQLQVQAGPNNRFTLRKGTYLIAIEGAADGLTLSEDVVTIGRGTQAAVDLTSRSAARIYQGKDLHEWMMLLSSEEDANSLGQIMEAVEVLTRDTDARTRAARETLRTARLWGGISSSSPAATPRGLRSTDPSGHYMHYLREVFPRYEAVGLTAIDHELEQGNVKSRVAAIWLLSELTRHPYEIPPTLVEHLEQAVTEVEASDYIYRDHATDTGKRAAVTLLVKQGQAVTGHPMLEDLVRTKIAIAEEEWKKPNSNSGMFGGSRHPWVLDEDLWVVAVEMEAAGRMKLNWKLVAEALVHERYRRVSDRTDEVFDAVGRHDSEAMIESITTRFQHLADQPGGRGSGGFGGAGGGGSTGMRPGARDSFWSGRNWTSVFNLATQDSVWPKALALYAQHTSDAKGSLAALENLRKEMIDRGADPKHADKPFQWIDAAIEKLKNAAASK